MQERKTLLLCGNASVQEEKQTQTGERYPPDISCRLQNFGEESCADRMDYGNVSEARSAAAQLSAGSDVQQIMEICFQISSQAQRVLSQAD